MENTGVSLGRKTTDLVPAGHTLRPLRDHLVVKPLEWEPSKTIQIAGNTRRTLRGTIVAAGPGCYPTRYNSDRSKSWASKAFRRTEVKPGDTVELGGLEIDGYDFPTVLIDNALHVICREEDVTGVVQ